MKSLKDNSNLERNLKKHAEDSDRKHQARLDGQWETLKGMRNMARTYGYHKPICPPKYNSDDSDDDEDDKKPVKKDDKDDDKKDSKSDDDKKDEKKDWALSIDHVIGFANYDSIKADFRISDHNKTNNNF